MEERELLPRIRVIKTKANRLANEYMAGAYLSVFKGRGMSFEEVRPYQPGDDVRTIDWNVSARTGDVYSKVFVEERELTFFLLVDMSPSVDIGTRGMTKRDLNTEVAASFAFSAIKNNDRVAPIIYTDSAEHFVPPKKGTSHVMRVIRDLMTFRSSGEAAEGPGGLPDSLRFLMNVMKKRANTVILSDFLLKPGELAAVDRAFSVAGRRHDLTCLPTLDPLDDPLARGIELPAMGMVSLEDPETGETRLMDFGSSKVRRTYSLRARERMARVENLFKKHSIDYELLWTDQDWVPAVNRLYLRKAKRKK